MSVHYNTAEFETEIHIDPFGFREYDARWLYPDNINLRGVQLLGQALGTLLHREDIQPEIITGHDYRSYSMTIKQALIIGLMSAGVKVHDIGLCTTPAAYFAQFELDCPAVAMVTASHNENGWTGVKMGAHRPLTFGPELMNKLKEICMKGDTEIR
jgi:phosphomannomutase/phosphoglucomutase